MSIWATVKFTPRNAYGEFVPGIVTPAVRAGVEGVCDFIKERAQALAPLRTGRLRDSIFTKIDERLISIRGYVAPNVPYAAYVEFGTGIRGEMSAGAGGGPYSPTWPGMAAQPYMRPALDEAKDAMLGLIGDKLSAAIGSPYK